MKTLLALETSTSRLSVALGTREGKVREFSYPKPLRHSENLIPLIDRLLKKEKLSFERIDALAIDRGPGSYTGLRIGFSLLKGFLAVRKRPCFGALALDMMAQKVCAVEGTRLGVLVDARREKIYSRFYQFRKGEWVAQGKLKLLSLSQWVSQIPREMLLVGKVPERSFPSFEVKPTFPSARTLVDWFHQKNPRLISLKTPRDFTPLYFRASEAEEKRRETKSDGP